MGNPRTSKHGTITLEQMALASARVADGVSRHSPPQQKLEMKNPVEQREMEKQMREFLVELKRRSSTLTNRQEMERDFRELSGKFPVRIPHTRIGKPRPIIDCAYRHVHDDPLSELVDETVDVSNGGLGGVGTAVYGTSTLEVAHGIASGMTDTKGELSTAILGDTAFKLGDVMKTTTPRDGGASASIQISVTVPVPEVCTAAVEQANGAMEQIQSAMDRGIAKIKTLTSIVGKFNGARDLLTTSIQNALDMYIARMMAKIMFMIETAHGITHPIFLTIFKMTWSENKQWIPWFIRDEVGEHGEKIPKWMEPCKDLVEYFDFVQEVFGGAINEVLKSCDKVFEDIVEVIGGFGADDEEADDEEGTESSEEEGQTGEKQINLIIKSKLCVPLMSISKQVNDLMKKMMLMKEIIRQKAKKILAKLKKMQAPELFINAPVDFLLILEVLIEAEFIYANLHIVVDKILEFFINLFVEKFTEVARGIIDEIMSKWEDVVSIVPPLKEMIELMWEIPNSADCCFNAALNIALPEMWDLVEPFVDMPFQCIDMISKACDEATKLAYATPEP